MNRKEIFADLQQLAMADLLVIALSGDQQQSFYAARVLEDKAFSEPQHFANFIPSFVAAVAEIRNPSVMRIYPCSL